MQMFEHLREQWRRREERVTNRFSTNLKTESHNQPENYSDLTIMLQLYILPKTLEFN